MGTIKKIFGRSILFNIECEINTENKQYLFSKMKFIINKKEVYNKDNEVFVLDIAIDRVKDFLIKYKSNGYSSMLLSQYITQELDRYNIDDIFSKLIEKRQNEMIESIEKGIELYNPLYDELDHSYLNFDWEPFVGYMFYFVKYDNYEWLFFDNKKNGKYISQKFCKGEFYLVVEEFYYWIKEISIKKC